MTCIVAIRTDDTTYMGADSLGSNGWSQGVVSDPKVFRNGPFLIGGSGSFRLLNFLEHSWKPPKRHSDVDVDRFIFCEVIDSLRKVLKENGMLKVNNGVEEIGGTGSFLMAYADQVYEVQGDLSIIRAASAEYALGSGYPFALASLRTSRDWIPARDRCRLALEVAGELTATVGGPFTVRQMAHKTTK